ncbi:hypothetical protein GT354_25225, partial [Streptomyces sp. SID3343]|nr:hypothetical protein [Streptomyces sp. SID3343]
MLEVASELRSVVVHDAGAVCVRHCEVDLPTGVSGPVRVRVTGFPLTAYGYSLRARVVSGATSGADAVADGPGADPGVRVTDVRPAAQAVAVDDADLPQVLLDLEAARERQRLLRKRQERLDAQAQEFASLRAVMPTPRRGDPPRRA